PRGTMATTATGATDSTVDSAGGTGETVLLVEDEAALMDVSRMSLTQMGFEVIAVTDPLEALRVFQQRPADICLLMTDIVMPGLSGPALLEKARRIKSDLPCVMVTGYAEAHNLPPAGASCVVLNKPFRRGELLNAIRSVMPRRSRAAET
ncbi:MAG: response regulator, partial [Planctomycetaceae bacterium]|nr:response regulator [Planctomycetaceae bacterium]